MTDPSRSINITEASIAQLQQALSSSSITSVELVSLFLRRVAVYDHRGPLLNSICVVNPDALKEARASDVYRASGQKPRPLEGIPFTIKDSFQAAGLTVAAASPAFANMAASTDAAVVKSLRDAGAVLIGKTNMPPMADGGSQRGLYGRSESPYNPEYLSTGLASGSSYGSGVATAASFAPIGLGGESVSSGRAPASNNALVGYSPSRGVVPSRGLWPLYPTCDVVAPHAKSVEDLLAMLNVIVFEEKEPTGDFWRGQKFVTIPSCDEIRPLDYLNLRNPTALQGKRIAIPKCYIGKKTSSGYAAVCSEATYNLWLQAKSDLEDLGATVVETDFPLVENYMKQLFPGQCANIPGVSEEWMGIERCQMIGMAWDDFLRYNNDPSCSTLVGVDPAKINPGFAPMDDPSQFTEQQNQVLYSEMIDAVGHRPSTLYDLPGCDDSLKALEAARKRDLEDWMDLNGYDLVAFPTNGDVGHQSSETSFEEMSYAILDGVKYSNGNRALKHLGVPAVTVPMGMLADKQMPVGLTFAGKGWSDSDLLSYAYAYETKSKRRVNPPSAPALDTDTVILDTPNTQDHSGFELTLDEKYIEKTTHEGFETLKVVLKGRILSDSETDVLKNITVFTNEALSIPVDMQGGTWKWEAELKRPLVNDPYPIPGIVARDQFMIIVIGDIPDLGHLSEQVDNGPATDHFPLSSLFARPFPYEESALLMHYLDHVFPMQYFYYSKTAGARGWLLWLLSKNGPLYRASLSLAALHLHFPHNREEYNTGIEYHSGALRELQGFISRFQEDEDRVDDERLVEVIACGAALISFEVLRGSSSNWQQHLHATASIVASMCEDENSFPPHTSMPWATGPSATLSFHIPVLLWIDILSCVSTREKPRLPYQQWMSPGVDVKLDTVMGCQNWTMKAIGDIACLREWKLTNIAAGTLEIEEYNGRRRQIEDELEKGLEALQISSMESSVQAKANCATHIFATAALVELQTLGADVSDTWSPTLLRRAVMRVIGAIRSTIEPPSARQIPWPICIAACVADPDVRHFFEKPIRNVLCEVNGMVGNCRAMLEIIQECWRLRDLEPGAQWECSSVMMKMGVNILLI